MRRPVVLGVMALAVAAILVLLINVPTCSRLRTSTSHHRTGESRAKEPVDVRTNPPFQPPSLPPIEPTDSLFEGIVLDESRRPVPGAQVGTLLGQETVSTDHEGRFSMSASHPGRIIGSHGRAVGSVEVDESGQSGLVILLTGGASVSVSVSDLRTGQPIHNARIKSPSGAVYTTDRSGNVMAHGVMTITTRYEVSAIGYESVDFVRRGKPGELLEKTVQMLNGSPASGSVVDQNGTLVGDSLITFFNETTKGWSGTARTNGDGLWSIPAISNGRHSVTVTGTGIGSSRSIEILLADDRRSEIEIRIPRDVMIGGTVTLPHKEPVSANIRTSSGKLFHADSDGRFSAATMQGDLIWAEHGDLASAVYTTTGVPHGDVLLILHPTKLRISLLNRQGLVDVFAVIRGPTDNFKRRFVNDFVELSGIPMGEYSITVTAKRGATTLTHNNKVILTERQISSTLEVTL